MIFFVLGENMFRYFFENFMFLMLYISNGNSFPKPLSEAEERYYLTEYKKGDKKARDILIERNLRLVVHIMKKYHAGNDDQEDLISIGTIGLIKGVNSYDDSKKTRLSTYCARCIENEVLMHFRSQKKLSGEVSLNDPLDTDREGNSLTLQDVMFTEEDISEKIDLQKNCRRIYKYIDHLEPREKMIVIKRYGLFDTEPKTQNEVAKELSISRSYVSRIEKKALEKLGLYFKKEEK